MRNSKSVFAAINPPARESTFPSGSFQFVHPVVVVWSVLFAHKEGKGRERMGTAGERKNARMLCIQRDGEMWKYVASLNVITDAYGNRC